MKWAFFLFSCCSAIVGGRHAIGFAEDAEEGTAGEAGEFGNEGDRVLRGGQQMGGMAQTVLVEESVDALAIGAGTDGIGDVVLVGAEELCQTAAVEVGIKVDAIGRLHEVADTSPLKVSARLFTRKATCSLMPDMPPSSFRSLSTSAIISSARRRALPHSPFLSNKPFSMRRAE